MEPVPFRPDLDLIDNAEGNDRLRRKDVAAAEALLAAGGWCAPCAEAIQDAANLRVDVSLADLLPPISASRGGFDFTDRRTDAEKLAHDAMQARVRRIVDAMWAREQAVIERAAVEAMLYGWDVHLYRQPYRWTSTRDYESAIRSAYVGIGFEPAKHPIPTIVEHLDHDVAWTDDDEWGT